ELLSRVEVRNTILFARARAGAERYTRQMAKRGYTVAMLGEHPSQNGRAESEALLHGGVARRASEPERSRGDPRRPEVRQGADPGLERPGRAGPRPHPRRARDQRRHTAYAPWTR